MAVAVSAGTESGGSGSAGGLWTDNKIATQVEAFIDGARTALGVLDSSIAVSLTKGGDAHLDRGLGDRRRHRRCPRPTRSRRISRARRPVAIAIGLSLAHNTVADTVAAYLANAVVATTDPNLANGAKGNISITATDSGTISVSSIAVAVSVAAGLGDTSVGVAGGGSESTNVILTTTNAYLDGATVGTSAHPVGTVTINATSSGQSVASATVAAVAASILRLRRHRGRRGRIGMSGRAQLPHLALIPTAPRRRPTCTRPRPAIRRRCLLNGRQVVQIASGARAA